MPRFSDTLLDHARYPRNCRADPSAELVGQADFGGQPPQFQIFMKVAGGVITTATFHAVGCGVTIAVGSVLTELLREQPLSSFKDLRGEIVIEALDGIPADKLHCVDVAIAALKNAIELGNAK